MQSLDIVIERGFNDTPQLHDGKHEFELKVQLASGDYFALLATRLDQVSQHLKTNKHQDYAVLEATVKDLLYLQEHYIIGKK